MRGTLLSSGLMALTLLLAAAAPAARAQTLVDFLAAADAAGRLDGPRLEAMLGATLDCAAAPKGGGCEARDVGFDDVRAGRVQFAGPSLTNAYRLSVLDLTLSPCLPLSSLAERFGTGVLVNGCNDAFCPFWDYWRPWGRISVEVRMSGRTSCVGSVTLLAKP